MATGPAKLFLKKLWVWFKTHWYIPLLLILVLLTSVSSWKKNRQLLEMIKLSKESYQKQIDVINTNHQKEIEKREALQKTYFDTIKKIEEQYKVRFENLEKSKKNELEKMVEKYEGDPESLANELSIMFGVENVN
jgi:hypothetical protein